MDFLAGLLLGFIIGCILTFRYFRERWLNIKGKIEDGKPVEQALFEQTMPNNKGEFIIQNYADQVMRDAKGDLKLADIIKDYE